MAVGTIIYGGTLNIYRGTIFDIEKYEVKCFVIMIFCLN